MTLAKCNRHKRQVAKNQSCILRVTKIFNSTDIAGTTSFTCESDACVCLWKLLEA